MMGCNGLGTHYWADLTPAGDPTPEQQAIEQLQEDVSILKDEMLTVQTDVDTLTGKVDAITEINPYIYGLFFSDDQNTTHLYRSSDGIAWQTIRTMPVATRDPNYFYHDGTHYILYTSDGVDRDFMMAKSTDFENWAVQKINVNAPRVVGDKNPDRSFGHCWGPQFVKIGNSIYYTICVEDTIPHTVSSIYGSTLYTFHIYYGTVTFDADGIHFGNAMLMDINYNSDTSYIDPAFYDGGSTVTMAIKNERDAKIEIYTAPTFTSRFTYSKTLPLQGVEGSILWRDNAGVLWCYLEAYDSNLAPYCYVRTRIDTGITQCCLRDYRMRHGCIFTSEYLDKRYSGIKLTSNVRYTSRGEFNITAGTVYDAISKVGIYNYVPDMVYSVLNNGNLTIPLHNVSNNEINILQKRGANQTLTLTGTLTDGTLQSRTITNTANTNGYLVRINYSNNDTLYNEFRILAYGEGS